MSDSGYILSDIRNTEFIVTLFMFFSILWQYIIVKDIIIIDIIYWDVYSMNI